METTYLWEDGPNGSTTMTLRNRGEPSGFTGIVAPVLTLAIKRANRRISPGSRHSWKPGASNCSAVEETRLVIARVGEPRAVVAQVPHARVVVAGVGHPVLKEPALKMPVLLLPKLRKPTLVASPELRAPEFPTAPRPVLLFWKPELPSPELKKPELPVPEWPKPEFGPG